MKTKMDPSGYVRRNEFTEEAARAVIGCSGETVHLENKRKETALIREDKLELIKHIAGMSNREGGFIVYGVENRTGRRVGICLEAFRWLAEPANISQCFSNHFAPPKDDLLVLPIEEAGLYYVVICVPRSVFTLHMAKKSGGLSFQGNDGNTITKNVFQEGSIPYRQGGQTVPMNPSQLNRVLAGIVEERGKDILGALKGVVKRPVRSLGRIVAPGDPEYQSAKAVRLVVGQQPTDGVVSIDAAPANDVHTQIAYAYKMWQEHDEFPPKPAVYRWYLARRSINVDDEPLRFMFMAALWCNSLPFYWAQQIDRETCATICTQVTENCGDFNARRTAGRVRIAKLPDVYLKMEYRGAPDTTCSPVRLSDYTKTTTYRVQTRLSRIDVDIMDARGALEEKLDILVRLIISDPTHASAKAAARALDYCLYEHLPTSVQS